MPASCESHGESHVRGAADHLLIFEFYADTHLKGEPEEYISIVNPTQHDIDISGCSITDLEGSAYFPPGSKIHPGENVYVTRCASKFEDQTGMSADYEYGSANACGATTVHSAVRMDGGQIMLRNSGDEIVLMDSGNNVVDAVIYGDTDYSGGVWTGAPLNKPSQGQIYRRASFADTDTLQDWSNEREYYMGQSDFHVEVFEFNGTAQLFVSPDSSFNTIKSAIDSSESSIWLAVYEFGGVELAELLANAASRGLDVKVLLDGSPAGGISADERTAMNILSSAGAEVKLMNGVGSHTKRYNFMHAKYAVIDGDTLIVMSENWSPTGIPMQNMSGNRGWGAIIENMQLAEYMQEVFNADWNGNDMTPYEGTGSVDDGSSSGTVPYGAGTDKYTPVYDDLIVSGDFTVTPVVAPDTSMNGSTVLGMIDSATRLVYVEQFYADKTWKGGPNKYLEAVVNASRRGCEVKVLLDSTWYNTQKDDYTDNDNTVEYINKIADAEGLDMEARLIRLNDLVKLHNKGVIADDGVLISSINWNKNSPSRNREAGLIIENKEVAEYYRDVFLSDWAGESGGQAQTSRDTSPQASSDMLTAALLIAGIFTCSILLIKRQTKRD